MKLFSLIALLFALTFGASAQEAGPQVTVAHMDAQACQSVRSITVFPQTGDCAQYVMVFISDTDLTVQGFLTVLNYTDERGNDRVQTQVTTATLSNNNKAALVQFGGVNNIKITSVQVTALTYVGATTTVTD